MKEDREYKASKTGQVLYSGMHYTKGHMHVKKLFSEMFPAYHWI
jgi:hypothetical protein